MECEVFFKLSSEHEGGAALVADVLVGFVWVRRLHVRAQGVDVRVGRLAVRAAQRALLPVPALRVCKTHNAKLVIRLHFYAWSSVSLVTELEYSTGS